ncbi:hypothetical protein [Cellulomonas fimi]|uniref:Uncharacterized protein n=1 Tax=Cellulomonas fimi (strain ATCC 484 / DSM 20113 / JCM 1341 / CCUG 24087 / LMG 16345 / NBRC 15513 / NCIMB 8980 / NCTC 7547 / NRS-133) TaxID=590998 RepID=F4H4G9_CELFA|nr:hypothetical protein [Cellulomonas fimi]AEE47764.1 hypothetical protein Celf_3657 [Cellulomonas fimi ATCC 484]VEH36957.1 Uncharacterised protein [Cellulomonas fimi]
MPDTSPFPDALPVLSAGRHRHPRYGGCAMEWASLLAGERWSDHPACTHPLLAHLTRSVNDRVSDDARTALAHLVPTLVGLRSDDREWALEVAYVSVRHALRHAEPSDVRDLVVALLTLDRLLAASDARLPTQRRPETTALLAPVGPGDIAWAERFTRAMGVPRRARGLTRMVVEVSVATVAAAPHADDALVAMLTDAVGACQRLSGRAQPDAALPSAARSGARQQVPTWSGSAA